MTDIQFSQDQNGGRFFIDDYAEMTFSKPAEGIISVDHTRVKPDHRGEGLAQKLYTDMVSFARTNNLKVIPTCSFVEKMFERNPVDREQLQA